MAPGAAGRGERKSGVRTPPELWDREGELGVNRKQPLEQVGMGWDGVSEGEFANQLEQL